MASELESGLRDIVDRGRNWLFNFSVEETELVSFGRYSNTGTIDVKMDEPVLEENSYFKMLRLSFSSVLDWGFYIYLKLSPGKLEP